MIEGSETDPQARIRELERRKADIDAEIARIHAGELSLLDDTALKDRFQQAAATARGLLSDFREVEQNFRNLDRVLLHPGLINQLNKQSRVNVELFYSPTIINVFP